MALSACASTGADMGSGAPAPTGLAEDARIARAVLPAQTPRAELLQPWAGPYEGVPPWDKVTAAKAKENPHFTKVLDSQKAFAQRAGQWQNDYTVDFKMAYNHYFGAQAKKS